jgi:hypothetical protein
MLRLLVELSAGIIIPVSNDSAHALDNARMPFHCGDARMESLTVSKQSVVYTQGQVQASGTLCVAEVYPHKLLDNEGCVGNSMNT